MNRHTGAALAATLLTFGAAVPSTAAAAPDQDSVAGSAKNMLFEVSPYPADLRLAAHGLDAELPNLSGLFAASDVRGHANGSGEAPPTERRSTCAPHATPATTPPV